MLENYPDINSIVPEREEIETAQILADLSPSQKATLADLESADTLLLVGDVLARASVLSRYLNKVKYGGRGNKIILIDSKKSKTSWFATTELIVSPGSEAKALAEQNLEESKNPIIVFAPSFAKVRNDLIAQAIRKIVSVKGKALVIYSLPEEVISKYLSQDRKTAPIKSGQDRKTLEPPEKNYPYLLIFEDEISHWMDGSISKNFKWAKINCPAPYLKVNPADAQKLKVKNKDKIRVNSKENSVVLSVKVSEEVKEGIVCVPHHFSEIRKFGKLSRVSCQKESI